MMMVVVVVMMLIRMKMNIFNQNLGGDKSLFVLTIIHVCRIVST